MLNQYGFSIYLVWPVCSTVMSPNDMSSRVIMKNKFRGERAYVLPNI